MSCVIGLVVDGVIWMGSDSAASQDDRLIIDPAPKVFSRKENGDEWLFGCVGSARLDQIVQYEMELPKNPPQGKNLRGYIIRELVPLVRKALSNSKALKQKEGVEEMDCGTILVGVNGKLFEIDSTFFILDCGTYYAVGSGRGEAIGALYATPNLAPRKRIHLALEISEATHSTVRRPFHIIKGKK